MAGKRYTRPRSGVPISENAADFATRRVIAHISENLSFYVVIPKFRRTGRIDRGAFPSGRETLHMARGVSRFRETFSALRNAAGFATRMVISGIPANLSFYVIGSEFRRIARLSRKTFPPGRRTLQVDGGSFPVSENAPSGL